MVEQKNGDFKTPPPIRGYMTREKALEILIDALLLKQVPFDQDFLDALKLAIHALQEVIKLSPRLPGV